MYQTYAVVGSVLLLLGVVYTYLFVRLVLGDKKCSQKILALSEAVVTVFIGIFYVYSAIILDTSSWHEMGNATNGHSYQMVGINDILLSQTEATSIIEAETENIVSELAANVTNRMSLNDLEADTETTTSDDDLTTLNTAQVAHETTKEKLSQANKTDQFLQKYQSFIREMMKDKLKNSSSVSNQTNKLRGKRDIKLEEEKKPNCYREFFIHNALLIYSFVHCLITVLNDTLQCKNCIENKEGSKDKEEVRSSGKPLENDGSVDSNSEKNEASAPVGPLFEIDSGEPRDIPDLKLFEAKIEAPRITSETIQVENEQSVMKANKVPPHVTLSLQVILTYLLPLMGIVILYCITSEEHLDISDFNLSFLSDQNFLTTQASSNVLNRIQPPLNITTAESLEVDSVIKNVYNIVNQVRENVTNKTAHFSPLVVETLYYMKPNQRNPKVKMEKCPKIDHSIKTYYFFIFIAAYFVAILYAKVVHIDAKSKKVNRAKQQNVSLLTFSALWLPSVLDVFFRMFVTQERATIFSDLFLALGNTNRIYTMASSHIQCKKAAAKPNLIKPETF